MALVFGVAVLVLAAQREHPPTDSVQVFLPLIVQAGSAHTLRLSSLERSTVTLDMSGLAMGSYEFLEFHEFT